jgi:hypothetical protein
MQPLGERVSIPSAPGGRIRPCAEALCGRNESTVLPGVGIVFLRLTHGQIVHIASEIAFRQDMVIGSAAEFGAFSSRQMKRFNRPLAAISSSLQA